MIDAQWAAGGDPLALRHSGWGRLGILLSTGIALFASATWSHASTPNGSQTRGAQQYSPWQSDRDSYFVSSTTDVGIIYARPRLMLGYGSPYWKFVALDAHWIATNSFTAPYVGWRASLPFLDAMMGARTVYPWDRRLLEPSESHGSNLSMRPGDRHSRYNAVDFELAAFAPLLHGIFHLQAHPVIVDAPRDVHLFEEVLRAVMQPPYALGTRAGYLYGVGASQALKIGMVVEYVILPRRRSNVTRCGPVTAYQLDKHWEAFFAFSGVVDSPDRLGIWHGPYAYLGLTHRWARRLKP